MGCRIKAIQFTQVIPVLVEGINAAPLAQLWLVAVWIPGIRAGTPMLNSFFLVQDLRLAAMAVALV